MDPILNLTLITMVCLHISSKTNQKFTCGTPLAANRTPNRTPILTQNRTCRRPLKPKVHATIQGRSLGPGKIRVFLPNGNCT
jgi:hypothetical protein